MDQKQEKATINPRNNDDMCSKYTLATSLNCRQIGKRPERFSKIKSSMNQYEWKEANLPSEAKDWKKFERNSKTIAFNVLFSPHNSEKNKTRVNFMTRFKA